MSISGLVAGSSKSPRGMLYAFLVFIMLLAASSANAGTVSGRVTDKNGPLSNVTVQVQGTAITAATDAAGFYSITGLQPSVPVTISAWKEMYYSAMKEKVVPPDATVNINLKRYQLHDMDTYRWIPPEGNHPGSCNKCHNKALMEMSLDDAHLKSAINHRFLTVYYGTDISGNITPSRKYKKGMGNWATLPVPAVYDKNMEYYGAGFVTEQTGTAGNCSGCHLPGASIRNNLMPENLIGADRTKATKQGADAYGIHCDFCHKVADLKYDHRTRMPLQGVTGVHAMKILRPSGKKGTEYEQIFFGPYSDPNSTTSTKLPLISQSQFCAPCHRGHFWGKLVYNSYGEWLESPYGKEGSPQFKTCQQCHMPSPVMWKGTVMTNTTPGKGGLERSPAAFRSHRMTIDREILKNALTMTARARRESGRLVVDVEVHNDRTGHHVPSDSPLRHLILHVEAQNSSGSILKQVSGPVLPGWTGVSGKVKAVKAYSGRPGKTYAKLLKERWTNEFPTVSYWNDFDIVSDNRLAAFARDASRYEFESPAQGTMTVTVSLHYRRAYYQMMEWKKWDDPDILMVRKEIVLP